VTKNCDKGVFNGFDSVDREDKSFLNVLYANVDSGLLNKTDELSVIINNKDPDLLIFNEILPKRRRYKKKLSDRDFKIDGYDFIIKSTSEGRGVIIYFKTYLQVQSVDILTNHVFNESIWLKIKLKGSDSLLVGNIYRSPSSSYENNNNLNFLLQETIDMNTSHVLIVGDFNYGSIDWELYQSTEALEHCPTLFTENVKDLFLYQHVGENTRHRVGQSSSRLDLIFSNEANMVNDLEYMPPLGASDHACLLFKFTCYTDCKQSDEPRPNFFKGNYPAMKSNLEQVVWDDICNQDLNTYWDNFHYTISALVSDHVPLVKPSKRAKKQPWLNGDAVTACAEKKVGFQEMEFL